MYLCVLFFCLGYLYFVWLFGATVCQTSKKSWWCHCFRMHLIIWILICSNGLRLYHTVQKLHDKWIGRLYDIDIFIKIILWLTVFPCTNCITYNFSIVIFFKNPYWLFHLDWLFEIWTDPEFVQKSIQEQSHFEKKIGVDILYQYQRVNTNNWMNLVKKVLEDNKHTQFEIYMLIWLKHNWLGSSQRDNITTGWVPHDLTKIY